MYTNVAFKKTARTLDLLNFGFILVLENMCNSCHVRADAAAAPWSHFMLPFSLLILLNSSPPKGTIALWRPARSVLFFQSPPLTYWWVVSGFVFFYLYMVYRCSMQILIVAPQSVNVIFQLTVQKQSFTVQYNNKIIWHAFVVCLYSQVCSFGNESSLPKLEFIFPFHWQT